MGLGFPNKVMVRLKYVDNLEFTSPTGSVALYRFSANGLYDPNITGTGHQPMYFDEYMALYNQYVVLGSKITVKIGYASSGNVNPATAVVIMANDNTTTTSTSIGGVTEQSQVSRTVMLDPFNYKTISKTYSAKRAFGGNPMALDNLRGTASTNPTNDWYFDIKYQTIHGSTAASLVAYVEIDYYVCFTELKDIGQS